VLGDGTDAVNSSFSGENIFLVVELLLQCLDDSTEKVSVTFALKMKVNFRHNWRKCDCKKCELLN